MSPYTDAYLTSRYSVSDEQLIPRPSKSIPMPESSRDDVTIFHPRRQRTEALRLAMCANTYCDNYEGSGTCDRKREDNVRRINGSSRCAAVGRSYSSDDIHNVADKGNSNKGYDNDDSDSKGVNSTHKRGARIRIYDNERSQQRRKSTGSGGKQWLKKRDTINQFFGSFILLVSTMRLSLACPDAITSICRCGDSQNGIILKCSHTDGSQVAHMLRGNQVNLGLIQQLEMKHSGLTRIPAGFFSGLFIKKLDLSYNSITDIEENSFLGMNNVLQELILHHNNLTRLPSKALTPLSALLRLDLSNNSIGDIEADYAFPPLSELYDVSLANNHICQIHKNTFNNVKYNIQTINLGRNCLKDVPASAIRGFKKLMALHLHNNNINSLGELSFMNLPLINLLNLASNQISTIHKRTFLNAPNLRYLYLTRNRITDILPYQFSPFEQLEMLDLTGNYLTEIRENSFSNLKSLRQLYLGENHITSIKPGSFANSSVVILILNSNHLVKLQEGMFDGLTKLQQLALKDNQIRSIDENIFYSNPDLAMLDLSNNELIDVPPSTFLAQVNLFFIDLSSNKLVRTPYGAFSRRVKTVLLQENPLVCSERVHMLQQCVGIYVASSEDVICGTHKNSSRNSIRNTTDATNTSTYFIVDDEEKQEKQGEMLLPPKTEPVIRPLSSVDNEVNKPGTNVGEQQKIGTNEGMLASPINVPVDEKPNLLRKSETSSTEQLTDVLESEASTIPEFWNPGTKRYENKGSDDMEMRNKNGRKNNQDSFDNTDVIHPFPVPFLKYPSKLSKAYVAAPGATTLTYPISANNRISDEQTLPPSIVVASNVQESEHMTVAHDADTDFHIGKNSIENTKAAQESGEQIFFDLDNTERLERITAPSVIILICLSTVAIVMAAVLIGLCIAKHRRLQTYHGSMTTDSAARTNAYVAAQLDMVYGTVRRNRNAPTLSRFDDGQPWIYAPTSYGTASYYK
ncbi:unnamed protein product [Litomosoides sigmodontis]|uniref:LRRNT domain-containing protein n=1 Tax=Litomosoides sigmodontis TaxID=42156 RepID=A0A3P6SYC8_LITSI|nr:unnamed protein product [Litomosoides sigmodontis]